RGRARVRHVAATGRRNRRDRSARASSGDGPGAALRVRAGVQENTILWIVWFTYGAFYFCRANAAAAVPGLQAFAHLDKAHIGIILGALKFTYGIGQFVNGQLAERIPARRLLALGMLGSAALNVLFGFGAGFWFFLFVWAANGYCQSLGW